jgi:hypothetical protein
MPDTRTLDNGERNLIISGLGLLRADVANDIGKPSAEYIGHTPELLAEIDALIAKIRES